MSQQFYNKDDDNVVDIDMKAMRKKIFTFGPIIITIILLVYLLFNSIYTVKETDQAVIETFGQVTSVKDAGLHFKLPYPIQSVKYVSVNKTEKLQIGYTSDDEKNATIATDFDKTEANMITGDFNIINIDFFIEWKISDPVKYLYNSNEPSVILRNIAQSSARSVIGSKNVDDVLTTGKGAIQAEIKDKILYKLDVYDLGIHVIDVKIQDSEPPTPTVIDAFKYVESAKQEKETFINEALAYKNAKLPDAESQSDRLIRDAESYKESRINEAKGEVSRFNEMYEEFSKNPEITKTRMYLETMEKILPGIPVYLESDSDNVQKMLPLKDFTGQEVN
jgi:membrane protease subunit HflK